MSFQLAVAQLIVVQVLDAGGEHPQPVGLRIGRQAYLQPDGTGTGGGGIGALLESLKQRTLCQHFVEREATRLVDQHPPRSEEHTSELQSRENLVCRLLLEQKK